MGFVYPCVIYDGICLQVSIRNFQNDNNMQLIIMTTSLYVFFFFYFYWWCRPTHSLRIYGVIIIIIKLYLFCVA